MNIVIVGHVDHGKSTIVGRLLADTGSLPQGKLEQVRQQCENNSKPFEYAFLLDALKDEQAQGITIDSARVFFKTSKRHYIIIDAPGHIEFLKNMVTGAARAEAALLVIDAKEGVQENSCRHGYMLSMLGIKQVAVLVNKMDLVSYEEDVFRQISQQYQEFLEKIGIQATCFIPVSGREGDMISERQENLSWYFGKTVFEILDEFHKKDIDENLPLRMPVQDIYKFTKFQDDRRIISGTISTGTVNVGDEVVFYPSGKKSYVKSIEMFNQPAVPGIGAGYAVGLTLTEQIYVKRGEMLTAFHGHPPEVTSRIKVNLFWMGRAPMELGKTYHLKLGTMKVPVEIEKIEQVLNASNLDSTDTAQKIARHEVAKCILKMPRAIAFDLADRISPTSRFVIVDQNNISGGGIIYEALEDAQSQVRQMVIERNYRWIMSNISREQRFERYGQKAALILITGRRDAPRKEIARALEERLFMQGKLVYFLGIGNVIHGLDADLTNDPDTHPEHFRRLAEVANIMLNMGTILIITAIELQKSDLEIIHTSIDDDQIKTVWVGDEDSSSGMADLHVAEHSPREQVVEKILELIHTNLSS